MFSAQKNLKENSAKLKEVRARLIECNKRISKEARCLHKHYEMFTILALFFICYCTTSFIYLQPVQTTVAEYKNTKLRRAFRWLGFVYAADSKKKKAK